VVSPDSLNIDLTAERDGTVQLFRLSGSLDVATSPALRAALMEAAEHEGHGLVVDLTQLEFLDSTGLVRSSARIVARRSAREASASLRPKVRFCGCCGLRAYSTCCASIRASRQRSTTRAG